MTKLVYGVGINDGKYPTKINGKTSKEYHLWHNLLERCYSDQGQKKNPAYMGCSVSENFKNFTYFYEWAQKETGFGQENYHLDKDILVKGNKLYSEDTCVFLPRELNNLLTSSRVRRGSLPIGVSAQRGKFIARYRKNLNPHYAGRFGTPEEAFNAYKQAKEDYIRTQAQKWKALIDPRAFAALMAYEVSISD